MSAILNPFVTKYPSLIIPLRIPSIVARTLFPLIKAIVSPFFTVSPILLIFLMFPSHSLCITLSLVKPPIFPGIPEFLIASPLYITSPRWCPLLVSMTA